MAEKKYLLISTNLFYYFTSYSTSNAPKTMELRFPRTFCLSHLPSILPSILDIYFWLVVVWKIIDRQPPKAKALPISLFFVIPFSHPKWWDNVPPPTQSNPVVPPIERPLYRGRQQSVDCYVLMLNSLPAKSFRREQNSYFLVGTYSIST